MGKVHSITDARSLRSLKRELAKVDDEHGRQIANAERVAAGGNPIITGEDLRDTCLSLLRNSFGNGDGLYERVEGAGGPSKRTIQNWDEQKVKSPQMKTLRSALRDCWQGLRSGGLQNVSKAPIRIGLRAGLRMLYIERHADHWLLPTNTNINRTLGAFIRLYDNGKVESVHVIDEPPYENVEVIKPGD
jgi:hypothetical protein